MSLSISSSKKAIVYTVIAATLVLLPAVYLVNRFISFAENSAGDIFGVQRIRTTLNALDYMAEQQQPTLLFMGSSLVKDGFSPRLFDNALQSRHNIKLQSFNIGLGNMNPAYQKLLAKRIREAFESRQKRAQVAIIEFNPFLATNKREAFRPFLKEQVTAVLMSDAELLSLADEDMETFARMVITKYLRNGVSAEAITGGIKTLIDTAQEQAPLAESFDEDYLAVLEKRRQLYRELSKAIAAAQPETKKSHRWNPVTRGGLIDMMDLPEADHATVNKLTANMQYEKTLAFDLQSRIECCDILELNFSNQLLADFDTVIQEFQQFSDRVEVVLMPRNRDIVTPTTEAQARLEQYLDQLAQRHGITVRNYQEHPEFDISSFYDATHLSMNKGRQQFSELLANDIGQMIATTRQHSQHHLVSAQ